jgi:hypothetical protein
LLILAGEIVFADRAADSLEGVERLALGMQGLALTTPVTLPPPDRLDLVHLIGFGDRRKAHDLPRLLGEHMADEVVLVQPLHDDDDGTTALVVEPAVEVWTNHSLQSCRSALESASSGFKGSSIKMISAPRPVRTPPVEVARRYPWRVVMNSCTAWRCANRVGKIRRYHGLIMMLRQSRASLSARSWA